MLKPVHKKTPPEGLRGYQVAFGQRFLLFLIRPGAKTRLKAILPFALRIKGCMRRKLNP